MAKSLLDEIQEHRKNIKHEALTFSLSELCNLYRDGEIVIQPDFQRLFRWSRAQQSDFIESILLDVPIPPIFFFERDSDGKWELLDGLQRLSTVIRTLSAKLEVPAQAQGPDGNEDDWHTESENNIDTALQFLPGEYLKQLSGLSFNRLPTQLQLNLKRSRLHTYILKRETHRMYKYEVFKRLNRGGAQLEEQELRNCSVRLIDDRFPQFLQDIAKLPDFVASIGVPSEDLRSGYAEELALRFLAMKNNSAAFRHDVDGFLTKYMEEVSKGIATFNYDEEKQVFSRTWKLIAAVSLEGSAFRGRNDQGKSVGQFSPTQFELLSLAVGTNIDRCEQKGLVTKEAVDSLFQKAKAEGLLGSGSNSRKKTLGRANLSANWFK